MNPSSNSPAEGAEAARAPVTKLIQERRFQEAAALCATLRARFPADGWLTAMHAFASLRLGLNEQAAMLGAEALRRGSTEPVAAFALGMASRRLGRRAEAVEALKIANRHLPGHVEVAVALLEETAAAEGLDAARPLYATLATQPGGRDVAGAWARLLFRAGLDAELPAGCLSAPLMSVRDWMAKTGQPLAFEGEPEPIPTDDPVVVGEPSEPVRSATPGYVPYACTLRDATVFPHCNVVLTSDGTAVNDTLADLRYGRFLTFMSERVVLERRGERLLLDVAQFKPAQFDAAVMLSGSVSEHFGHWVPEYLCRLNFLVRHPRFAELPILVDANMPASHLDYLRRIVPNRIISLANDTAVRVAELIVAGPYAFVPVHLSPDHQVPAHMQGGFSVEAVRFIRDRVLANLPPPSTAERLVYLSRRNRAGRRPVNEDEIGAFLAARGFEIVFPEDLSFDEQVRTFQEAKLIVAPNGSSVLNAIFAPPHARILILSQRSVFNWATYCGLMGELGYEVAFICGDDATDFKNANYMIPLDRLAMALGPAFAPA